MTEGKRPTSDKGTVTETLVMQILDAHPNYRVTQQYTKEGRKMTLIEYPNQDGFLKEAPEEFIEYVEALEETNE